MSKKETNLKIVSEAHTDQKEKQKALDAAISQIDSNFGGFTRIAFAHHLTRDNLMLVTWATTRH